MMYAAYSHASTSHQWPELSRVQSEYQPDYAAAANQAVIEWQWVRTRS
jgi:hypothetical protein